MAYLPRGIDPQLLLSQVKNTTPYLLSSTEGEALAHRFPPAAFLRKYAEADQDSLLSHFEYFQLCVSAHFLTCATPVPTDVDNQIRFKLWPAQLPLETALEMAQFVLEIRKWDFTQASTRFVWGAGEWTQKALSGHAGEWFTVAAAAYGALKRFTDPLAHAKGQELFEAITEEVHRHSEIFASLWKAKEGLECLKASATIAHNLGDLDRVMDMWDLNIADPLRLQFYRLSASPLDSNGKLRYLGRLWVAGELYKAPLAGGSMAFENHRHFALRKPKCLRESPALWIPIGPFFDDWGKKVAQHWGSAADAVETLSEVISALKQGWERLPRTVGYGRALRGIQEVMRDLDLEDVKKVPAFRTVLDQSQKAFEKSWNEEALKQMDEIPSRA